MMTTDKMMTESEIRAATSGELRREVRWLDTWIRILKWEYSVEYRIAQDRIMEELDRRDRLSYAD